MKRNYAIHRLVGSCLKSAALITGFLGMTAQAQTSYTFTSCGATGQQGPNQGQVNTAYASTNLQNNVTVSGLGVQQWTVPITGVYGIRAVGASGGSISVSCGNTMGGYGASMSGEFNLTAGQVILVLVGQKGLTNGEDGGGGGGSFVTTSNSVALVVAGGGGGASNNITQCGPSQNLTGVNASTNTAGTAGALGGGIGGTNGSGGTNNIGGGGTAGGGFLTNGVGGTSTPGFAFMNGGTGSTGSSNNHGGFGGGGCGWSPGGNGGGGGGYSGGGTGGQYTSPASYQGGGGGGSFNSGTNQVNGIATVHGDGYVVITRLCMLNLSLTGGLSQGALCSGSSATLTSDGISNYSWSTGATSASIVISPTTTTSYSLTAMSPSNCITTAVITVTVSGSVPSLTVVNTASTSAGICPNRTVNLTASGALSYTWSGGSQTVTNGVTFSPTLAAHYTVTGANGCGTSTAVTSVSVHPLPVITPVASSNTLCSGSQLTLTAQGNASTYTWTGGSVSFTNGIGFVPLTSTIYSLTGTSALNCTAMATMPVTVYVTPTLAPVASPVIVCIGNSSTLSAMGANSYTWISASQTVNTSTMLVTPTSTGITTYTVIKANSNCMDIRTINLITNDLPVVAAIAMPPTVCALSPATLAAGGALTYTWTAPGTPNYTFTGASNIISTPVPATYTVAASDGTCVSTATVHLATNPIPTIAISVNSASICAGQQVNLGASGANNYTWTSTSGTFYTASITDSPTVATAYQVTGDNSFGCTSQASQVVLVYGSPTISAGPDKNLICNGTLVTFTASGTNSYTWTTGSGQQTGSQVVLTPSAVISGPVIYTVTGEDNIGCQGTRTTQVNVYVPVLSVSGSTNACEGSTLQLTGSGGNSNSYSWNTGSGSPVAGPVLNTTLSAPSIFTLSASSTSLAITCPVSQTIALGLYPNPVIVAAAERTTICARESVQLYASGGDSYQWNNGASGGTITVSPAIQTNYTVSGTDGNGCKSTGTVQVRVSGCVGIGEHDLRTEELVIYPNPNNGVFTIKSGSEMNLVVVNELGQLVQHIELSASNNYQVSVKELPNGIYFISGQSDHGRLYQKVVVTK
jgi:hypothetical protein